MPERGSEKRIEERWPMDGCIRILLDGAGSAEITGRLMDISARGFRACHTHATLTAGQTVQFQHEAASGKARVIWNRITPDRVETGFLIV